MMVYSEQDMKESILYAMSGERSEPITLSDYALRALIDACFVAGKKGAMKIIAEEMSKCSTTGYGKGQRRFGERILERLQA